MMSLQVACEYFYLLFLVSILFGMSNAVLDDTSAEYVDDPKYPRVAIPQGTLQGITVESRKGRKISSFLGIPYAEPPIGGLRFSNPIAAGAWCGILDATTDGSSCPQPEKVGEEDCLYLNVHTPQLPRSLDSSLLPVMVYIPGGGFATGSGDSKTYGPGHLLDVDIVLVSMNYRLGPLGFLSTGDKVASGNWGLKDQVLALKWVKKNIAYFGGDPNQVTIFGQSAGGGSVQLLALSNTTIGLFHKTISQSGSALANWAYRPRSTYTNRARQLGEFLNCPTYTSALLIDCLRDADVWDIINTKPQFLKWNAYPLTVWGPTDEPDIEGAFLTDAPSNLLETGKIRDLPSITGIARDEAAVIMLETIVDFATFDELLDNLDDFLPYVVDYIYMGDQIPRYTTAIKEYYFNDDLRTDRAELWSNCAKAIADYYFIYPVYTALQKQLALAKNVSFFYFFEYRGTYSREDLYCNADACGNNVAHGDELLYLFPEIESLFGAKPEEMSMTDHKMIDTMVQLWTSFAINGTPTTTVMVSNTSWLPYSSKDNYLRIGIGSDASLALRHNFLTKRTKFWKELSATASRNTGRISLFLKLIVALLIVY